MGPAPCPDENALGAFVDGRLDEEAFATVERHLDTCAPCREVASAITQVRSGSGDRSRGDDDGDGADSGDPGSGDVPRETRIGRFVVMGALGRGGMGVVYRAHDPALDRDVALKLLRTDGGERGGGGASARLSREAKAMARVRHENVIAVHDVGVFEGRVFLTMELIEGETLASWLGRAERSAGVILAVFEKAGLGLAAAHDAGLVHRDFKPDNVLVGRDGRVLVTDFGLACAPSGAGGPAATGAGAGLSAGTITGSGALLGTPAYMAPEQLRDEAVSAATDQFSFCVALWEALAGAPPFADQGDRLGGRLSTLRHPRLDVRVRRVLARGLRASPGARYPSMRALLRALVPPRSRVAAPAAALIAVALAAGVAFGAGRRTDVCASARVGLPGVWDAERKQAVGAALLATGKPYAADTVREVDRVLDGYAATWTAMRQDACEATLVRHDRSADLLDRRMRCLDGRRAEVLALVTLLAQGGDTVARAATAVHELGGLGGCTETPALLARAEPPREAGARAEAEAIEGEIGAVRAALDLGRTAEAKRRIEATVVRARALGRAPELSRALLRAGMVEAAGAELAAAETSLREAAHLSDGAGDDETRTRAWMELARLLGYRTERVTDGLAAADEARTALTRLGGDDALEAKRLDVLAIVLSTGGRTGEAVADFRQSLALRERALGPDAREVGESLSHLGGALVGAGRDDDRLALEMIRRATAIHERIYGPQHPVVAVARGNLARVLFLVGRFPDAVIESRRAILLTEAALGPEHPSLGSAIGNLALALDSLGQREEALIEHRRALALFEHALGPKHRNVAVVLANLGATLTRLHRHDEAEAAVQRALAILGEILPPYHPLLADPLRVLGELRLAEGRPAEAREPLERSLSLLGSEGPATRAETRLLLARALSAMGKKEEAAATGAAADADVEVAGDAAALTRRALAAWRNRGPSP